MKNIFQYYLRTKYMIGDRIKKGLAAILLLSLHICSYAQQPDTSGPKPTGDSNISFVMRLKKAAADESKKSIEKYQKGRLAIKQEHLLEDIKNTAQSAKIYLKHDVDTVGIASELRETRASIAVVNDGIFANKGAWQTQRNLAVSTAILGELLTKITELKATLADYENNLNHFRDRIDSLTTDSALLTFSSDSAAALKYGKRIVAVAREINPTDSGIDKSLSVVRDLQPEVDMLAFEIRSKIEDIEKSREELTRQTFEREFANITGAVAYSRPFNEIMKFSFAKEKLALHFFIRENKLRLLILFLLVGIVTFFLRSLKERLDEEEEVHDDFNKQLVLRHTFLSSVIIVTSLFQFIFLEPPFIFSFLLWFIAAICLTIIFRGFIAAYWMRFWLIMIALFLLASFDNMVLQASRSERWLMLALSVAGAIYGTYILLGGKRRELKEKGILYFIGFEVLLQTASVFYNFFGRYNLAKTLMVCGYTGVIFAILFLWTVRFINEGLAHTSSIYKHPDKKLFYINFDKIGDKVPNIFYIFLVIGWLILVGRNFYSFQQIVAHFNEFLTEPRSLGSYNFTINGLFIFLVILLCSVILSRLISFFASEPGETTVTQKGPPKVALGSWLLLIRIFIISLGLFLAFAAAGLPLDKLTIVLGALSVGVGLGLQGLVNNLVSGLIIAFEKPVNVGDIIEINNRPATLKSIGFRSSVVILFDGASLIIPNGDLLSQHLVNWTMSKHKKRLSITVNVAYGSDLEKVKQLLGNVLNADQRVLNFPLPMVLAKEFGESSINFELLFWVRHMKEALLLRSDVISQIDKMFKAEGIVIPFPQQDLHIRSVDKRGEGPK